MDVVAHVNIRTGEIVEQKVVLDNGDFLNFASEKPTDCVTVLGFEDDINELSNNVKDPLEDE